MHVNPHPHTVGARRPVVAHTPHTAHIAHIALVALLTLFAFFAPTMQAVPAAAAQPAACSAIAALEQASRGLLMPSESDYPFIPFVWKQRAAPTLTPARLLEYAGHAPETPVVVVGLREFFRHVAQHQPWHDSAQAAQVRQFRRLVKVLEANLTDIRVYRVGSVHIDVYIVGKAGRDLVGLATVLIET